MRQLRAVEKYLGRIVDPHKQRDQRPGGAIGGADPRLSEIDRYEPCADLKERSCEGGSDCDVLPLDPKLGNHLVDESEEKCFDQKCQQEIYVGENRGGEVQVGPVTEDMK